TNHLDIAATEWLESYMRDWPGAVMLISHDRYFLDQVVDQIVELEAGRLDIYPGSYSDYQETKIQHKGSP
ncbi:MAG: ABC-F family ATP-binding cassette domain-containing protein, partial [Anaerolineales bacterium]|nr:ABC-F family ATP-binding cassette domain-containing protein [Anaerolineales bacterium]